MPKEPTISDLKQYLRDKIAEIVDMPENDAKAYDTAFTWAVVRWMQKDAALAA